MAGERKEPWPAGASANPGGRPKKTEEMRRGEELMRSRSEDGVRQLIELSETSEDDNVRAKLLVFRYEAVYGKAVQQITAEIEHKDGAATPELVREAIAQKLEQMFPRPEPIESTATVAPALPAKNDNVSR